MIDDKEEQEQTWICSRCRRPRKRREFHERSSNTKRPVTAWCRFCRSDEYLAKKYKTVCPQCLKHKKLDKNKICRHCNAEAGLKQCAACNHILPLHLEFYSRQSRCKRCLAKASKRPVKEQAPSVENSQSEVSASD